MSNDLTLQTVRNLVNQANQEYLSVCSKIKTTARLGEKFVLLKETELAWATSNKLTQAGFELSCDGTDTRIWWGN